jgi:Fe-S-cluster containining protein
MIDSTPECLQCGACCFSANPHYVPVSGDDHRRLGDLAEALTLFHGNRCFMRMADAHCAALTLTSDGRFVCQIYEQRPAVCRELTRGGASCQAELSLKGASAKAALLPLHRPA